MSTIFEPIENQNQLEEAIYFEDLCKYGANTKPRLVKREDNFMLLKPEETLEIAGLIQLDKTMPYYKVNVKDAILVQQSKRSDLIQRIEKLEWENDKLLSENKKLKRKLKTGTERMYSKKEKQLQQVYILADAIEGKNNITICKEREISTSAVSRVLSISVKAGMNEQQLQECRERDLARLKRIYDRKRECFLLPFEIVVVDWYENKVNNILEHRRYSTSQVG